LGKYFQNKGLSIKAIQSFERAISAAPRNGTPYAELIELYRNIGKLNQLCDRWLARYRADTKNEILKSYLIEALHKADRFEEARQIIK
jgi:hypothetical protein